MESGAEDRPTSSAWIAGLLFVVHLTTGCAGLVHAPGDEPPDIDATQRPPIALETKVPSVAAPAGPPEISKTQAAAAAPEPVDLPVDAPRPPPQRTTSQAESTAVKPPAPSVTTPSEPSPSTRPHGVATATGPAATPVAPAVTGSPAPVTAKAPAAKTPAKVAVAPASPEPPAATERLPKKESVAPSPAKPEASPPLDLKSLETRLKETKAIGVFTKLTLKNQVDDLLNQFRAFYQGRLKSTLAQLRQSYDRLLLKVLALLQDADPPLAQAIVASREAIWGILADPVKFTTL